MCVCARGQGGREQARHAQAQAGKVRYNQTFGGRSLHTAAGCTYTHTGELPELTGY